MLLTYSHIACWFIIQNDVYEQFVQVKIRGKMGLRRGNSVLNQKAER